MVPRKKKKKQTEFVWKPSEYKLSPIEGEIVLAIDESGSAEIATLVATIRDMVADFDQVLPTFAAAIERLHRLKLITMKKYEQWGNTRVAVSLDNIEIATVLQYLSDCPATEWFEKYNFGPCDEIEICANYPVRG